MYEGVKSRRDDQFLQERRHASFSSILLDEIYRSIDDGNPYRSEPSPYRDREPRKLSVPGGRGAENGCIGTEKLWTEKKVISEKPIDRRRQSLPKFESKGACCNRDPEFFTSSSSSSDSSSGGFSSSEVESVNQFVATRLKPIRTTVSEEHKNRGKTEKTERKTEETGQPLSYKQRESKLRNLGHYLQNSFAGAKESKPEERCIDRKLENLKVYEDLKKTKQPISPGARLISFINSLFTAGNAKRKAKTSKSNALASSSSSGEAIIPERRFCSGAVESECSSTSSFSRSCLIKTSPSSRARLRDGIKRSVRFYPVSVIVDEDCRPCGHKCLIEEDSVSIRKPSISTTTNRRRSPGMTNDREELRSRFSEKTCRGRQNSKNYRQIQRRSEPIECNFRVNRNVNDDGDDDDDNASYSSSDLFELDNLGLMGNGRYCDELPVYETTRLDSANRWLRG